MLQFIDSASFMGSSLSNLLNSLSEGIHKIKCKYGQDEFIKLNVNMDKMIKNVKIVELNISIATVFLNIAFFKGDLIKCKCLSCDKNYQYKLDKKLEKIFISTCNFSNHNNSRFIDLLRKGINIL